MTGDNLKKKTVKGVFWNAIDRFGVQGTQFLVLIILARLLEPSDFGLIGMLAIFVALSQTLIDSGFGAALIQKKGVNQKDYSTIFFFNIAVSVLIYLILFFTAPLIANFYNEPQLTLLTRVISLNFIFNAFALIQITNLKKNLDFKTQSKVNIASVLMSSVLGVVLAVLGYGVWVLVFQTISNGFFKAVLFWVFNKWRPSMVFSKTSFKSLFSFGSKILLASLLNTIFQNLYLIVIGKYFNASSLGFYTQAKKIQELPTKLISNIIQTVSFSAFSLIQDEDEKLKNAFRMSIKMSAFVLFPLMTLLFFTAETLVVVALTDKWLESVVYIQILSIVGILYPLQLFNLSILNVKGRSDLYLKLEIIKKVIIVIAIIVGFQWGVLGLVVSRVCTAAINFFINMIYTNKIIKYSAGEQMLDIAPYLLSSILMGLTIFLLSFSVTNHYLLLTLQVIIAPVSYLLIAKILKLSAYQELKNIAPNYLPSRLTNIL